MVMVIGPHRRKADLRAERKAEQRKRGPESSAPGSTEVPEPTEAREPTEASVAQVPQDAPAAQAAGLL